MKTSNEIAYSFLYHSSRSWPLLFKNPSTEGPQMKLVIKQANQAHNTNLFGQGWSGGSEVS